MGRLEAARKGGRLRNTGFTVPIICGFSSNSTYLTEPSVYPQTALLPSARIAPHSVRSPGPENNLLSPAHTKNNKLQLCVCVYVCE